jgi:hypothetical protein
MSGKEKEWLYKEERRILTGVPDEDSSWVMLLEQKKANKGLLKRRSCNYI